MRQSWTKQKVREAILGLHKAGKPLNSDFIQKNNSALYGAACCRYGNWPKAIKAAGFKYAEVKAPRPGPIWTKEQIVAQVKELYQKEGKINSNFAQTCHRNLYQRALYQFGTWKATVEAAGFDYQNVMVRKRFRSWTKAAIVAEIKRRMQNQLPLNGQAVARDDPGLYHAATRHFGKGGWDKALRKIGLSSDAIFIKRVWTDKKVVDELRALHQAGTPLYGYYLVKNGYESLFRGAIKRFGSWKKAVEAAGFNYEAVRKVRMNYWNKKRVIQEIQRLEKLGIRLSSSAIRRTRCDLLGAGIVNFGSWCEAVEAAGINYQEHLLVWSTKAWLRKLSRADVKNLQRKAKKLSRERRRA
jgi:hypothetical protein